MGQFPERLGELFAALKVGLREIEIYSLAAILLILPYRKESGDVTQPVTIIWSPTKGAKWGSPLSPNEQRACQTAINEACQAAGIQGTEPDIHIMQVPYFVKPISVQTRDEFNVEDVIYKTPRLINLSEDTKWITSHPVTSYVQRYLFTFVFQADEERLHSILGREGTQLSHFLGAFFSWAGVVADELARSQLKRIASFQLLRAHQLGNNLKAIFEFDRQNFEVMERAGINPTPDTIRQIRKILLEWRRTLRNMEENVRELSQVASALGHPREGFNWYQEFILCLESFGARPDDDGATYSVQGVGRWQTLSVFDLHGIEESAKNAHIFYTRYHFAELLGNLFKNAKRVWEHDRNEHSQEFKVTAKVINGSLEFTFANQGRPIGEPLKSKLFRYPVPDEAKAIGGNGVGHWALGMSFETYGIPMPSVKNLPNFGPCFIFLFPAKLR